MTPEERAEVAPSADNFSKVFGDRTEEPMSVTAADTAVSLATPVDSVVEVQKELQKEDPDYLKIGMLAGVEALGSLPALGPVAKSMIRKGADLAKQTDTAIEGTTNIPSVSKKEVSPFDVEYDYDLTLKMEDMIDEWAKGNVTNANLRKNLATLDIKLPYRIGPKADPSSLDIQMPDGTIYKGTGDVPSKPRVNQDIAGNPQLDNAAYTEKMSSFDTVDDVTEWKDNVKKFIKESRDVDPVVRTPELEDAAQKLIDKEITRQEYLQVVDKNKPVTGWDQLPREPSTKAMVYSLKPNQVEGGSFVLSPEDASNLGVKQSSLSVGDFFDGRLDVTAYKEFDTWIVAGAKQGEKGQHYAKAIHYQGGDGKPVILLNSDKPKKYESNIKTGERIGSAQKNPKGDIYGKTPYAAISGYIKDLDVDNIRKVAAELLNDPQWVQLGFDPRRQGNFYVRKEKSNAPLHAVATSAEEVIQIGPLVLAKNPVLNLNYQGYNKGGMAMEEQTQMAFALGGSVEDVDPVSGNEVPPGSLPEEVRDDIDARLSEGEYVVPADVVRFFGVKFFEDLRNQAKAGFEDMEANGRIGGQPVPEENPLPFDLSELQVEEEPVQMNEGGFLDRDALEAKFPASFMGSGSPAQEWKTFENEAGLTITIRYVNGQPMSPIPAGYTEVGARSEQALEVPRGDDSDPQFGDPSNAPEPVDLSKLSEDELEKIGDKAATMGTLEEIVGYGTGPALTQIMRMTREGRAAKVNSEVASRLASGKNADGTDLTESQITQLGKIFDKTADTEDTGSRFFGGQRTLTEGLQDTSGDKQVGFADTFLGDLLGFDGTPGIQATDKDGNKLGLDASIAGKRRKPVVKPAVGSGSNNDGGSDDNYSAADQMKDRLDRMAKAEGQSEGFSGSTTSGAVYAGGNRSEGGLMLKKSKKKNKK